MHKSLIWVLGKGTLSLLCSTIKVDVIRTPEHCVTPIESFLCALDLAVLQGPFLKIKVVSFTYGTKLLNRIYPIHRVFG